LKKFDHDITCVILGARGFIGTEVSKIANEKFKNVIRVDLENSDLNIDMVNNINNFFDQLDYMGENLYIINLIALNPKVETLNKYNSSDYNKYKSFMKFNIDYPVLLTTKLVEFAKHNMHKRIDLCLMGSIYANTFANKNQYPGMQSKDLGYIVSKHGLSGLIRGMKSQYLPENFRINMINPGAVENTEMPDFFKDSFVKISGGKLNSVSDVSEFICNLGFAYESLYSCSIIDITGGAIA